MAIYKYLNSIIFISVSIQIRVLPQISLLPDHLAHVYLDWLLLTAIDAHLHPWTIDLPQILKDLLSSLIEIGLAILVLHVGHRHMNLVLGSKIYTVIVLRNLVGNFHSTNH